MIIRLAIFYGILFFVNSCGQGTTMINTPPPTVETPKKASLTFDFDHVDFGQVVQGETKDTTFTFTNTGNEEVVIELVTACECTTFDYPRGPIKQGERGEIPITFDSRDKNESETITIDIILKNIHPDHGYPIVYQVTYDFDITKP